MSADANVCSNCGYNFNTGPYSQPPSPGGYSAPPAPGQSPYGQGSYQANYPRGGYDETSTGMADGMAIAGLVLGILSLPMFCIWCLGIPCAVLGLIFGGIGLKGKNRGMAIAGMTCAALGILLAIIFVIFASTLNTRSGSYPFG
jgi:hypothetical protein